jgi:hypothetical protein
LANFIQSVVNGQSTIIDGMQFRDLPFLSSLSGI